MVLNFLSIKTGQYHPAYAVAYNNRGNVYRNLGQYQQAIADYDKAIELNPNDAVAHNNRGHAYADQGQYQQTIADFDKAIELDPDVAPIWWKER